MIQPSDADLLAAYRAGDEEAARMLFERYYQRLVTEVGQLLGMRLRTVEEPSDVVQSALLSVFRRTRDDRIALAHTDNLWPLLAAVAINKVRTRARYWARHRRNVERNVPVDAGPDPLEHGPDPQDVAAAKDIVGQLLDNFSAPRRRIITLILEGYRTREIAEVLGTTERTVYSTRRAAAHLLTHLLEA